MTAKEISQQTDAPLKTVQSHIYRAREMLKKNYRKEWLEA
jgi:RNA polymerase sigma-70 factor (ECF subfamily)